VGATRHVSHGEKKCNQDFSRIILAILAVAVCLGLMYAEWDWKQKNDAYMDVRYSVSSVHDTSVSEYNVGQLVHLTSSEVAPDKELVDADFGFHGRNSLRVKRRAEYCQWQEFSRDQKDERNGETYRTYYYVKGWHSHTIPSVLFHQPFHHHNPLRDPYPSNEQTAYYAKAGNYFVTKPLLERLSSHRWAYYDEQAIKSFQGSPASREFRPIGGGYYYSSYQEGTGTTVARLFGMVLEGSFDLQLGDLFSHCTAGDIRVHYEIADPESVSVIGGQIDEKGGIGLFQSRNGYNVGIMYGGIFRDAQELFDKDLWDHFLYMLLGRFLGGLIFAVVFHVLRDLQFTAISVAYWSAALVGSAWVLVRVTDVSSAMLFCSHNPVTSVLATTVLVYLAYTYNFVQPPKYATARK